MENIKYMHIVQYYETDKMGITHHSNYVRWMEEARVDFFDKIGWNYAKLEKSGIFSPVISVNCKYKISTTFGENIEISVDVAEYNGVKLTLKYLMTNSKEKIVCEGTSEHCFINDKGKLIKIKKEYPKLHETLSALGEKEKF